MRPSEVVPPCPSYPSSTPLLPFSLSLLFSSLLSLSLCLSLSLSPSLPPSLPPTLPLPFPLPLRSSLPLVPECKRARQVHGALRKSCGPCPSGSSPSPKRRWSASHPLCPGPTIPRTNVRTARRRTGGTPRPPAPTRPCTRARAHACVHTYACLLPRARAHTHTYTHTPRERGGIWGNGTAPGRSPAARCLLARTQIPHSLSPYLARPPAVR